MLQLSKDKVAGSGSTPKYRSPLGKKLADLRLAQQKGDEEAQKEIIKDIVESQTEAQAESRAKQMKTADTMFATGFGIDLESDLSDEDVGPQYQSMVESAATRNVDKGEDLADVRSEIQGYFTFNPSGLTALFGNRGALEWSDRAREQYDKGKIALGRDANGRAGLYKVHKGKPTKFITWVDEGMIEELDPSLVEE